MNVNEAIDICFKKNVLVYPVLVGNSFYIEIKQNEKISRIDKKVKQGKEVGEAMAKTYIYLAKKIIK